MIIQCICGLHITTPILPNDNSHIAQELLHYYFTTFEIATDSIIAGRRFSELELKILLTKVSDDMLNWVPVNTIMHATT